MLFVLPHLNLPTPAPPLFFLQDKQALNAIATAVRAAAAAPAEPEPILEEINFDDSTVLKYLCGTEASVKDAGGNDSSAEAPNTAAAASAAAAQTATARAGTGAASGEGTVVGLRVIDPDYPLSASGLSTIYTMHFCGARAAGGGGGGRGAAALPPLLAAGGKGGVVALFSTRRQQQVRACERRRFGVAPLSGSDNMLLYFHLDCTLRQVHQDSISYFSASCRRRRGSGPR